MQDARSRAALRTAQQKFMRHQSAQGTSLSQRLLLIVLVVVALGAIGTGTTISISGGVAAVNLTNYYNAIVPSGVASLKVLENESVLGTRIYDRTGQHLLAVLYDPSVGQRQVVALAHISPWVLKATVSVEDPTFYSNPGFDPKGIARAVYEDLRSGSLSQGGSGITQQLVKRTVTGANTTFSRKINELLISVGVTRALTKDQILELYLNIIFYGNQCTGIGQAARFYFHTSAAKLDLAQASFLAGLPQAPSYYDPVTNLPAALLRQQVVLAAMVKRGTITTKMALQAANEAAHFAPFQPAQIANSVIYAPHFVDFVQQQLVSALGYDRVYHGGLKVITTLNLTLNNDAQTLVTQQINQLTANGNNATDGALVSIDPKTREILAMIGSPNYNNPDPQAGGQINMATTPRQPGSSFKPFTYITDFEQGGYPAQVIRDAAISVPQGLGQAPYQPHNYDHQWHGAVTIRFALANSLNIPAVKTIMQVGIDNVLNTTRDFGITSLSNSPNYYGPSLTLGSGAISLLQMTNAYAVFASGGLYQQYRFIRTITDSGGHTVAFAQGSPAHRVASAQNVYLMTSVLSDGAARSYEFGIQNPLVLPDRPAAVKTGTTDSWKDNWTIGYTPDLVTGVWVGNANDSPMVNIIGITGAGPIWQQFMEDALASTPPHDFIAPPGIITTTVAGYTCGNGPSCKLATNTSAWPLTDVFAAGAVPHQWDAPIYEDWTLPRTISFNMGLSATQTVGTLSAPFITGSTPSGPGTRTFHSTTILGNNACQGQRFTYVTAGTGYQYTCYGN